MPYIGDITFRIASASALEHTVKMRQTHDVDLFASTKASWVTSCFGRPDQVPHALKCLWIGAAIAASPTDLTLALNRSQDLKPMLNMARDGTMPLLLLQGDSDHLILAEKVIPEIKAMWKDVEVVIFKGIGHAPFYEDTEGVMKSISAFVKRLPARGFGAKL